MLNIPTLISSIIVAIFTSFLSVYLALRKYRTEKWWDKKVECYLQTIKALNDIIRFCDNYLAEEFDDKNISIEEKKKLETTYHTGKIILETQLNIGRLLLSENAYDDLLSLDRMLYKIEQEENIIQEMAGIRGEVEACLYSFIPNAKLDLGVKRF